MRENFLKNDSRVNMSGNIILKLENEIFDLEKKIENVRFENFKIDLVKNLKISKLVLKRVFPYVIFAGSCTGFFYLIGGGLPFYLDSFSKYSHYMKVFDNEGNIRIEKQYEKFNDTHATLNYYGKWTQNDGIYFRTKQIYDLENISEGDILKLFDGQVSLSDFLGTPVKDVIETRNNLSEKEIGKEAYMEAIVYGVNENDVIVIKEAASYDFVKTVIMMIFIIYLEIVGPLKYRKHYSSFNYEEQLNMVKEKYQHVDICELKKLLVLKKANYNRLMR